MRKSMWVAAILMTAMLLLLSAQAGASEEAAPFPGGKSIYNILLIGSDQRDETWNGNSDVMILVTLNANTQKIVMTSFMRDLYADIPGYGVNKLNYAFAAGGADTLVAALEGNYRLKIDAYMIVNFASMAAIVDDIGGVEMTIEDEECEVLNMYLESMEVPQYSIACGGDYLLNGYQAVAYMRIRFVGNSDYQRTQRQRDVLDAIFAKMKEQEPEKLLALTTKILPELEHNIGPFDLMQLTAALPSLTEYELEGNRIPYDDLYSIQGEMLVPEFEETIQRLHAQLGLEEE